MKSQITRSLPNDEYQAAIAANAPSAINAFATIADIPAPAVTLYSGDGTIGTTRVATLTDTLNFVTPATGGIAIGLTAFLPLHALEVRAVSSSRFTVIRGFNTSGGQALQIYNSTQVLGTFNNNGFINLSPLTSVNHVVAIGNVLTATAKLTVTGSGTTSATLNQTWRASAMNVLMTLNDEGQLGINTVDWTSGVGGPTRKLAVRDNSSGDFGYHTTALYENTISPTVNNSNGARTITASSIKFSAFNTYEITSVFSTADNQGAGAITEFYSQRSYVLQRGAGAIASCAGYYSDKQSQAGSITTFASYIADCTQISGGTITNMYGLYVKTPTNISGGTITNSYGVLVEPNSIATNDYGFVSSGDMSNGLGTAAPSAQALLELVSTTKAFLLMRMTAVQASAITPADGMMLYVTTTDATFTTVGFWKYEAGVWLAF